MMKSTYAAVALAATTILSAAPAAERQVPRIDASAMTMPKENQVRSFKARAMVAPPATASPARTRRLSMLVR